MNDETAPYCLDCLQPRNSAADRHCRATSTRTERTYHRWSNDDDRCPCGLSHTRSEHGYDPDRED